MIIQANIMGKMFATKVAIYLKKLLIGLTVLFSFIFVSNVKAATFENIMDYVSITNLYGLSYEEIIELGNSVGKDLTTLATHYEKWKESNPTNFFLFIPSGGTVRFIPNASKYNFSLYSEFLSYYYLGLRINDSSDSLYSMYYSSDLNKQYSSSGATNITQYNQIRMQNIVYIFYISDVKNINFSYSKYRDTGAHTYVEDDLIINGNNYSIGDELPISIENGFNSLKPQGPKIDITSILKNELGEKININFSEFDKEKYIYLYNFNNLPGNENWHEITENDYEYSSILNGTLYIKSIDREQFLLNGDTTPIVSSTYVFTDLLMYEDIIDTYKMSDYAEIEYRYYGTNPAIFLL